MAWTRGREGASPGSMLHVHSIKMFASPCGMSSMMSCPHAISKARHVGRPRTFRMTMSAIGVEMRPLSKAGERWREDPVPSLHQEVGDTAPTPAAMPRAMDQNERFSFGRCIAFRRGAGHLWRLRPKFPLWHSEINRAGRHHDCVYRRHGAKGGAVEIPASCATTSRLLQSRLHAGPLAAPHSGCVTGCAFAPASLFARLGAKAGRRLRLTLSAVGARRIMAGCNGIPATRNSMAARDFP